MDIELARKWAMLLTMGVEAGGVLFWVRQLGLLPGAPGEPRVAGSGQSGKVLNVSGLTGSYVGQFSQFFTVITGERRYGYKLAAAVRADGAGTASFAIEPALRAEPADGDVLEIGKPYVQGLLADLPEEVSNVSYLAEGFGFTIREAR